MKKLDYCKNLIMSDAFISYFFLLVTILFAKINVFIVSILMPLVFTYGIYSVFKKESLFKKSVYFDAYFKKTSWFYKMFRNTSFIITCVWLPGSLIPGFTLYFFVYSCEWYELWLLWIFSLILYPVTKHFREHVLSDHLVYGMRVMISRRLGIITMILVMFLVLGLLKHLEYGNFDTSVLLDSEKIADYVVSHFYHNIKDYQDILRTFKMIHLQLERVHSFMEPGWISFVFYIFLILPSPGISVAWCLYVYGTFTIVHSLRLK